MNQTVYSIIVLQLLMAITGILAKVGGYEEIQKVFPFSLFLLLFCGRLPEVT